MNLNDRILYLLCKTASEAYRAALILLELGAFSRAGANGPFADSDRQKGYVDFGTSHYFRHIGATELAQRSSWYQKWQVHLFARPEALGGTLHNTIAGYLNAPFHTSLLENSDLLERVAEVNAAQNPYGEVTYLLPQVKWRQNIRCYYRIYRTPSLGSINPETVNV